MICTLSCPVVTIKCFVEGLSTNTHSFTPSLSLKQRPKAPHFETEATGYPISALAKVFSLLKSKAASPMLSRTRGSLPLTKRNDVNAKITRAVPIQKKCKPIVRVGETKFC